MKQEVKESQGTADDKIKAWLSLEVRLDDFSIKKEQFEITGWINVFWKWDQIESKHTDVHRILTDLIALSAGIKKSKAEQERGNRRHSRTTNYKGNGEDIIRIGDLRESDISYYLPIDALKIFHQPTLLALTHIDAPCLYYNAAKHTVHTQYYIHAILSQSLELFMYPFDRQYLDLKLRWNKEYYDLLDYDKHEDRKYPFRKIDKPESGLDVDHYVDLFGPKGSKQLERNKILHYRAPVQIYLKESLRDEVKLYPPEKDFKMQFKEKAHEGANILRCALIRIRVRRNPCYVISNIIMPFFIIVSCSFSAYAIAPGAGDDIANRLSVSLTILLTFTAFQSIISDQLPQTTQMLLLDIFIIIGYALQSLIILGSCLMAALDDRMDQERIQTIDVYMMVICGSLWVVFSVFYFSLIFKTCRKFYDTLTECCFGCEWWCLKKVYYDDWEKRGEQAIDVWIDSNIKKQTYPRHPIPDPADIREEKHEKEERTITQSCP